MTKLTELDPSQISRHTFDAENNAQRVILTGGDFGIAEAIQQGLKNLKIELPQQEMQLSTEEAKIIEKLVPVYETKIIEVPTIIKEIEIKEIEKPVIIEKLKLVAIDKPIIVTEYKKIEIEKQVIVKELEKFPSIIKYLLILQTLSLIALAMANFLHK